MARRNREEATVSFHYLLQQTRAADRRLVPTAFEQHQFDDLSNLLLGQPVVNLKDQAVCRRIEISVDTPIEQCEKVDTRTIFGIFRSLYSGHAYDNTKMGEIPADSVSLRPFFFLLYFSESGRIYIAAQYLGQYGGYHGLLKTLMSLFPQGNRIISYSFRHDSASYRGAKPKAVRVGFSRKPTNITGRQEFGSRGALTFKQSSNKDLAFNTTVSTQLLAKLGQPEAVLRKALVDMLKGSEMLALRDDDIEDCTVVATIDGKSRAINIIEAGSFATRFPLNVGTTIKGHPDAQQAKMAMLDLLKRNVIARSDIV